MDNGDMRPLVVAGLVVVVTASCGAEAIDVETSTTVDGASTTVFETTITVNASGDLVAHCGSVELPFEDPMVLPDQPLDDELLAALDEASRQVGTEFDFLSGYEWSVAERGEDVIVLFGRITAEEGYAPYADARLELRNEVWVLSGWGTCRLEVSSPGYGSARWMLDPDSEPDPASSSLKIQINEQACASGEAPVGREVLPVVVPEADRVTITVLVASHTTSSTLTCPGNPWFPVVVELGAPWAERALFDGSTVPAEERTWPPDVPGDFES